MVGLDEDAMNINSTMNQSAPVSEVQVPTIKNNSFMFTVVSSMPSDVESIKS